MNQQKNWEKKYDKLAGKYVSAGGFYIDCYECNDGRDDESIKSFISQLLQQTREEAYSKGYHDGRGERDFTGREIQPKGPSLTPLNDMDDPRKQDWKDKLRNQYGFLNGAGGGFLNVQESLIGFISSLLQSGRQSYREEVIKVIDEWLAHYPTDIFIEPPAGKHGKTVDACSARAIRHFGKVLKDKLSEV